LGNNNEADTLLRCEETYKSLTNPNQKGIASRDLEEGFSLRIDSYSLKKTENTSKSQYMLRINSLTLEPGYVYAISGTVGTGKTTFLSDIANCLNSVVFKSFGTIYYPTIDGKKIPMIFCGTEPFSPPDTTLFERLTYRLPQRYVDKNAPSLAEEILDLFKMFGQNNFTEETLSSKEFKGSTGQGKIAILIAAIIYKHYLDSPVLFAIDETLANLDRGTFGSVCKIIGSEFEDSIVVSVDHNWKNSNDFYNHNIDLISYAPKNDEVKMVGELNTDLDIN
ncbi:MAG: ATP-binding cassette domain-containing protein, partial [Bacteroidota bacterium]